MTTLEASHTLRCRLAAQSVEADLGVIRGCTVAKAGVQATGKFVMIDANGAVTYDEKLAKKRLPVFTDAKTLDTLMQAAKGAGKRVKMREDHDDSVGARAGYVADFKRISDEEGGDRVVTDLHVFKSYRNRDVFLETVRDTPEEIGLSIDFTPTFELQGDRALMRVVELSAVDIVDEGAITHDGLLLSASVDSLAKSESPQEGANTQPVVQMASPTNEEIMSAIGALTKSVGDCMAAVSKLATPPAPAADEALKAAKAENEKLAASVKETNEKLSAVVTSVAQLKKEKALLGFRGTDAEKAALAASPAEDIEKLNATKKTYLQLVEERVAAVKCKKSEAHLWAMRNHRAEYALHLAAGGIYDPAKVNMKAS